MSAFDQDNVSDAGSGFRTPSPQGRGRSQSTSSTDRKMSPKRSSSISALRQAKKDYHPDHIISRDEEGPTSSTEVNDTTNVVDTQGTAPGHEQEDIYSSSPPPSPGNELAMDVEDFCSSEWANPVEALKKSVEHIANNTQMPFDYVMKDWKMTCGAMTLILDDTEQATYHEANIQAIQLFKVEDDATADAPPLPEEQVDLGFRMLEHHGDDLLQSMQIETQLFINGKLVGNSDEDSLKKLCIPCAEAHDDLILQASYLFPEHNLTYIFITMSRWASGWEEGGKYLKKLGDIVLPMIKAQEDEPKLQILSSDQAASLLGIATCETKAVQYTIVGTPRCNVTDYMTSIRSGPIKEAVDTIIGLLDSNANVTVDLVHPIYEETEDMSLDYTVRILEKCTEGWHRDSNDPLAIYFANSPSKRMLDLRTIPKDKAIPLMDKIPALATFDTNEQYYVAMAIGNQQEKEYQDRQIGKLTEFDVPVRFLADPRTLHPKDQAPQEYFMLIDSNTTVPEVDYLLPRIGDSADIVLKGVSVKRRDYAGDMSSREDDQIVMHITASVWDADNDHTLTSRTDVEKRLVYLLSPLCVTDDSGNEITENLDLLRTNLDEIRLVYEENDRILEFVKSNRAWLRPPPPEIDDEIDPFTNPARLRGHRIDVPSKLWPATTHVWKLQVPADKQTAGEKLPLLLDLPDLSTDEEGKPLKTLRSFSDRLKSDEMYVPVKIRVIDSDKTHKAEMNALRKLMAPHTMPLDDRPSLASINASRDLISAKLRDGEALKDIMPAFEQLRRGKHPDRHLQRFYQQLSKDKHGAIEFLLDDKKLIKYIHGPAGTGKSYLALWIACLAVMSGPPAAEETDRPVDVGPQLSAAEFDKVYLTQPMRTKAVTDAEKAASSALPDKTKVLIVSGQNTAVDDLFPRFWTMWKRLGGEKVRPRERAPIVLRLYSWKSEARDFIRAFAKVGRHIQRTAEDSTGGILMRLLGAFSDEADSFDRRGRKARRTNMSIVDKAIELYQEDRKKSQGRKYDDLAELVTKVSGSPEQTFIVGKQINKLVMNGPQKDALAEADVILGTPVGVADKTVRENFRPHYIISDESPRDKEISFLILLAHFSPRAFFCFGDHKQLSPVIMSTYQHLKYKPPRSFKRANNEDSKDKKESAEGAEPDEPEKDLPKPSTFANQMSWSAIHRLMAAGHPTFMLSQNFRQHGWVGEFFNKQFYNGKIRFKEANDRFSQIDLAAIRWLRELSGQDTIKGNSLMINPNSFESCEARSFSNVGNVNMVLTKLVTLLADDNFNGGTVMIIAPYEAQRNLYTHELQKRSQIEITGVGHKAQWVSFDKSRIEIRTHQGAQGHQAHVVIVDLTRSDSPGMTGQPQLINICSSRSVCAQVVLLNDSVLRSSESRNAPSVRHLVAWTQFHRDTDMLITIDSVTAN
ncbi:hypothetical protein J7T55_009038 [Diaporthe amygdali]|uniref:uncharacterized protein n=1 Tax=Phomopsis amygdali TaxID=1214568 RepID=UPI0022FEE79E|nr:uncharacterized protein J7T55_009038 [Diaporthe amygdali]KAJ0118255.1 hypothetical protein J7T55_009038 [Diaporthe amygdali]